MAIPISHRHNEWAREDGRCVCKCGHDLGPEPPDDDPRGEHRMSLFVLWNAHRISEIESELAYAMDKLELEGEDNA